MYAIKLNKNYGGIKISSRLINVINTRILTL